MPPFIRPLVALLFAGCVTRSDELTSLDRDGDGWYHEAAEALGEEGPFDCDDARDDVNPGVAEVCDGADNDCDGEIDDGAETAFYADGDEDGFGNVALEQVACVAPSGFVDNSGDCDDGDSAVNPGIEEACNGYDDDCDGASDESGDLVTWFPDADGDGFGIESGVVQSCAPPDGFAPEGGDCDEGDAQVNPGADEVWYDGLDSNCDLADDYDADADGHQSDGWGGADCDDGDAAVSPDAAEICKNGVDDDCDGSPGACGLNGDMALSDANVILFGEDAGDMAGWSLATLPDIDADGDDEILIGAPYDDDGGVDAGAAYLVLGPPSGTVDLSSAIKMKGNVVGAFSAMSIAACGDLDGDGIGDIGMGSADSSTSTSNTGIVHLISGASLGGSVASAFAALTGEAAFDAFGGSTAGTAFRQIAGVGDMDADGNDDLLVGAYGGGSYGRAYLFYGPLAGAAGAGSADVVMEGMNGDGYLDRLAEVVEAAGDTDGDGRPDAVIGDYGGGAAYLLSDPPKGVMNVGDVALALTVSSGPDGVTDGVMDVSRAGDVDGDGRDDLIVGSAFHDAAGDAAGAAYLVLGRISADMPLSAADATLFGEATGDFAGFEVAGGSDINADGFDDLVIGAPYHAGAGAAYVVEGPIEGTLDLAVASARMLGNASDTAGIRTAMGDVDGDGFGDIIVSAPGGDLGAADSGSVYVFNGTGW